jgi:alkylation response protein AidB-like acyl-CoA dehydrogenase
VQRSLSTMTMLDPTQSQMDGRDALLLALTGIVPELQRQAVLLDDCAAFPEAGIADLRKFGALGAPVQVEFGGLGMGTEPEGAVSLMEALRLIGRGNLSLGRLYEAHVNVLHLVSRYGSAAQRRHVASDAAQGHLHGLWVTDAPDASLRLNTDFTLHGAKFPCSGAGYATRALVTAEMPSGETCMLLVALTPDERVDLSGWNTHGMRATASGRMVFNGMQLRPAAQLGQPGDYLRQPNFSAGAWRTSAVTLGGLEALVTEMRHHLVSRGRDGDPHQRARVGRALIAQETARLWVRRAAHVAEAGVDEASDIVNTVNLGRIAVEAACLDAIQIAQRSLGLAAFSRGTLVELLFRDLGMYLRQPAPDETLTEAAAHFMRRPPHDILG